MWCELEDSERKGTGSRSEVAYARRLDNSQMISHCKITKALSNIDCNALILTQCTLGDDENSSRAYLMKCKEGARLRSMI